MLRRNRGWSQKREDGDDEEGAVDHRHGINLFGRLRNFSTY